MTTRSSALRKASARIEALEGRSLFSGELDRSFLGTGGGQSLDVRAVAVQPNNYTVLAAVEPGTNQLRVTRLTTSGGQDGAFGKKGNVVIPSVAANRVDSITVLPNGKILVGGPNYVRLNANGTLDSTFGGGDGIAPSLLAPDRRAGQAVYVYPDGSFVELGDNNPSNKNYVFKYKADGSPDKSFGSGGAFNVGSLGGEQTGAITADASGRIYAAFEGNDYTLSVVRLTTAGKLDKTWGVNGVAKGTQGTITDINALTVLSDGRVIAGWSFSTSSDYYGYDLFSSAGKFVVESPLNSLGINGTSFFAADSITQAKDGSVYIGGSYYANNSGGHDDPDNAVYVGGTSAVVHLNKDLTLDKKYSSDRDGIGGFGLQGKNVYYVGHAVANNGSVVLVGRTYDGTTGFARLTGNGVANRVSATVSTSNVVVTGSDQADYIAFDEVYDDRDGSYDRVIFLDAPTNGVRSADVLLFNRLSPDQKFTVNLKGGNDRVDASRANYTLHLNGGSGDDYINGSRGRDVINGDDGDDRLYAYESNETTIHGNAGNDVVGVGNRGVGYGDDGDDNVTGLHYATLYGGSGNDLLGHATSQGYPGLLDGGTGDDTAFYISGDVLKSIEHANLVP